MDSKTLAEVDSSDQVHEKNDDENSKVVNDRAPLSSASDTSAPAMQISAPAVDLLSPWVSHTSAGTNSVTSTDLKAPVCPLDAALRHLREVFREAKDNGIEPEPAYFVNSAHALQTASPHSAFMQEVKKGYLASGGSNTTPTLKRKAPFSTDDYILFGSPRNQRQPSHFSTLGGMHNAPPTPVSGGSSQNRSDGFSTLTDDALVKALDKKHKEIDAFRIASQEAYDNLDTACEDVSSLWNELYRRYRSKSQAPHQKPRDTEGEEVYNAAVVTSDDAGEAEGE